jgi:8-oxo-dGTP pyrophosphatase MutT (NUDIX family)
MKLDILNTIEKHILRSMMGVAEAKYSDLKPDRLESNAFNYHLKRMISKGFIQKTVSSGYSPTRLGRNYLGRVNMDTMDFTLQPKVLTMLAIESEDGQWLMLERTHQPYLGYKGFPSGKIHQGEEIIESAQRELFEKTGLTGVDLILRGSVSFQEFEGVDFVFQILEFVYHAKVSVDKKITYSSPYFTSKWVTKADFFSGLRFPGHELIFEQLEKQTYFHLEAKLQLPI